MFDFTSCKRGAPSEIMKFSICDQIITFILSAVRFSLLDLRTFFDDSMADYDVSVK